MAKRPPRDTAPILRSQPSSITYGGALSGGTQTSTARMLIDDRPFYGFGRVGKIGNKSWRFPTDYVHQSREVQNADNAFYSCRGPFGYCSVETVNPAVDRMLAVTSPYTFDANQPPFGMRAKAQTDALNKIADQKAGLGEDIATYAQTVKMFTSKGALLSDLLHAFVKDKGLRKYALKSVKETRRIDKHAANAYLEYVYGWKPLMEDIHGIRELLNERASGRQPIIVHGTGKAYEEISFEKQFERDTYGGALGSLSSKGTRKVRCDIHARVDPSGRQLRTLNQLGLLNPVSLAYELMPWSFVVDWFVPIGPFLQALTAPVGLIFISGTISYKQTVTHSGSFIPAAGRIYGVTEKQEGGSFNVVDETYRREVLGTWPLPSPYISQDPFKGDRAYKALALAISSLHGIRNGMR